jgi:hypothetical protein
MGGPALDHRKRQSIVGLLLSRWNFLLKSSRRPKTIPVFPMAAAFGATVRTPSNSAGAKARSYDMSRSSEAMYRSRPHRLRALLVA